MHQIRFPPAVPHPLHPELFSPFSSDLLRWTRCASRENTARWKDTFPPPPFQTHRAFRDHFFQDPLTYYALPILSRPQAGLSPTSDPLHNFFLLVGFLPAEMSEPLHFPLLPTSLAMLLQSPHPHWKNRTYKGKDWSSAESGRYSEDFPENLLPDDWKVPIGRYLPHEYNVLPVLPSCNILPH